MLEFKFQISASRAAAVMQYWPVEEKVACVGGTVCPTNVPVTVPKSKIKNQETEPKRRRDCFTVSHHFVTNLPIFMRCTDEFTVP